MVKLSLVAGVDRTQILAEQKNVNHDGWICHCASYLVTLVFLREEKSKGVKAEQSG